MKKKGIEGGVREERKKLFPMVDNNKINMGI